MRLTYLSASIILACTACQAQEICFIPKQGPSAAAEAAFEKIAEAVGIRPGTILIYASSDALVKDRSGALSVGVCGANGVERWILYDPDLIKGDGLYFALAHETAHHLNNDPMSGEPPSTQIELRADGFGARYLTRPPLDWTSQRLMQALNSLPIPAAAQGFYPSLDERRARVSEAYASEYARLHPNPDPPLGPTPPPKETLQIKFLWRGMMDVDKSAQKQKSVPVSGSATVFIDGKEIRKVGVVSYTKESDDLDLSAGTHEFVFESSVTTVKGEYVRSNCKGDFVVSTTAVMHPKLAFMAGAKVGMCRIE
jgi:hypothetical protein